MSAIGAAARYDPPALAAYPLPVEPVRPLPSRPERHSDRGEGAADPHRFELRGDRERDTAADVAPVEFAQSRPTVVPFPVQARRSADFTPFLAQQIAQQEAPVGETVDGGTAARAAAAYRQAAGDQDLVLGFVRSRRVTI